MAEEADAAVNDLPGTPLSPRDHLDAAHDHLHHAMDGLDGVHPEPDADEHGGAADSDADDASPRDMGRRGYDSRPPWQRQADAVRANPVTAPVAAAMRGRR